ncbi:MAG: BON domain-containing protein [Deltaproteobacteria bacterium]|nr:BON domain-containing protein [Deltaproteobacteria bacterium]
MKESWLDSVTKTAVRYKLTRDKSVKARHMEIDVWRGVVTLHGRVQSADERQRAEELARQVKRVVIVDNHLSVMTDSSAVAASMGANTNGPTPNPATASMPPPVPHAPVVVPRPAAKVTPKVAAVAPKPTMTPAAEAPQSVTTIESVRPSAKPVVPTSPSIVTTAPAPRKAGHGKTLPWLGELPDEEGPTMHPTAEVSERSGAKAPAQVSADEGLAREAAEELKRLKGTP